MRQQDARGARRSRHWRSVVTACTPGAVTRSNDGVERTSGILRAIRSIERETRSSVRSKTVQAFSTTVAPPAHTVRRPPPPVLPPNDIVEAVPHPEGAMTIGITVWTTRPLFQHPAHTRKTIVYATTNVHTVPQHCNVQDHGEGAIPWFGPGSSSGILSPKTTDRPPRALPAA